MGRGGYNTMPRKKTAAYLFLAVFFFAPWTASAAGIMVTPYIGIASGYSDNLYFSETGEIDDFILIASPGISVNYTSELLDLQSEIGFGIVRYLDETDANTINQMYTADVVYRALEKLSFNGNFSYTKDTTLESELQETGILGRLSNRHSYNAGGGLTYEISEVSDIDIGYSHGKTAYELSEYTDHTSDDVSIAYNYTINDRLDVLSITPIYRKLDSDISKTDIYGISLGISHVFTETLHSSFHLGTSHSDTRHTEGRSYTRWGWTADASLEKSWQTASASISYTRNTEYTYEGEPAETNRFSVRGSKMLTKRLGIGFTGSYYYTKSLDETQYDLDTRYLEVTPSIKYMITANHSLELVYDYSYAQDKNLTGDNEADRNMVWLIFSFTFPQKW